MTTNTGVRWIGPRSELMSESNSLERLYDQFFGYPIVSEGDGTPTHTLPVDILETEDAYELYASAAGVPEDAVEVTFDNGMLSVMLKAVPFQGEGRFIRQVVSVGAPRSRKLELPKEVGPGEYRRRVRERRSDGSHPEGDEGRAPADRNRGGGYGGGKRRLGGSSGAGQRAGPGSSFQCVALTGRPQPNSAGRGVGQEPTLVPPDTTTRSVLCPATAVAANELPQ